MSLTNCWNNSFDIWKYHQNCLSDSRSQNTAQLFWTYERRWWEWCAFFWLCLIWGTRRKDKIESSSVDKYCSQMIEKLTIWLIFRKFWNSMISRKRTITRGDKQQQRKKKLEDDGKRNLQEWTLEGGESVEIGRWHEMNLSGMYKYGRWWTNQISTKAIFGHIWGDRQKYGVKIWKQIWRGRLLRLWALGPSLQGFFWLLLNCLRNQVS